MNGVKWIPKFELGIKIIDDQHKYLVEIIKKFVDNFEEENELTVIEKVLNDLGKYAKGHFSIEEKYLDEFKCENIEQHRAMHREFEDKIQSMKKDLKKGKSCVPKETLAYVASWFTDHELIYDRAYIPCFHEHGL